MSDAKISALTSLTGANIDAVNDVVPIVDTSVTTTKKSSVTELGIAVFAAMPNFAVNRNGVAQTITNSTPTKIQFTTEEWDTLGCFDSATNYRFTPTISGKYFFQCFLTWSAVIDSTTAYVSIYKNGVEVKREIFVFRSGAAQGHGCSGTFDANGSTDYFEFFVTQSTGLSIGIDGSSINTRAVGFKVG